VFSPAGAATRSIGHIAARGVSKSFGSGGDLVEALAGIDLDIPAGEFVCVVGPSGCGKSTLLNIIAGFELPSSGRVEVSGRAVKGPGPDRGVIFQEYALFPWLTVRQNIEFGLRGRELSSKECEERSSKWIEAIGLRQFAGRFPRELSGGMRQRVAIARALAVDAEILLMDEPFAALDYLTRFVWQRELESIWQATGRTVLMITHNVEEAVLLGDRVVTMTSRPGKVKGIVQVDLSRPRDVSSHAFNDLRRSVLEDVISEVTSSGEVGARWFTEGKAGQAPQT
jgi:ABC-type nitrate/sulfonate/bicarbonate transport system ATPase subunit